MKCFALIVAYDGTNYHGWQDQPGYITVAKVLQDTFKRVFFKEITIKGASRTDAGVHAYGQVAMFKSDVDLDATTMMWAWNNALPSSVVIRHLQEVDEAFHLFAGVRQKTYVYTIFTQQPLPFVQRNGWYVKKKIDEDLLKQALAVFVGTHNFRSFSTGDCRGDDTVRTIDAIDVEHDTHSGIYRVIVRGPHFLRYMVRRIVGAAIDVATCSHRVSVDFLRAALLEKNPRQPLTNAPPQGLMLYTIVYEPNFGLTESNIVSQEHFFFPRNHVKLKEI